MSTARVAQGFARVAWSDRGFRRSLTWGLLIFVCLVLLHISLAAGAAFRIEPLRLLWQGGVLRLDVDHSVPELVEYVMLALAVLYLMGSARKSGAPVFLALALVNLLILLDAVLRIHEWMGHAINPDAFWKGQLVFFALLGAAFVAFLVVGFLRSSKDARALALLVVVPLAGLFVSAVLFDAVHTALKLRLFAGGQGGGSTVQGIFAILEDGGELLFLILNAVMCQWIYRVAPPR